MIKSYTFAAAALSLVLLGGFYWWFQSSTIATGVYALVALLSIFTVPLMYRFTGYSEADDTVWLQDREAQEHLDMSERLKTIRTELDGLSLTEGVRQVDLLSNIINDYHSVVETRFFDKANLPITYLGAARTVQKHAVQNLADSVAVGHSMSTLSRNYRKAEEIENNQQQVRHEKQNELYDDQKSRLSALFEENNQLFHSLTETAVEIANIKSFSDYQRTDAQARLVALAEIASKSGQ